jgi:cytochrome b561
MTPRLNLVRRLLHWIVALIVVVMIPAGLVFTNFDNKGWIEAAFGVGSFNSFYDMHKSMGVVVFALMAARIGARFAWPAPPYQPRLPVLERALSTLSHVALYLLLIAVPVLGYLGTATFPAPVPVFGLFEIPAVMAPDRELSKTLLHWHGIGAFTIAALSVVHVCAALWHRNVRQDGVFNRIALRRIRRDRVPAE